MAPRSPRVRPRAAAPTRRNAAPRSATASKRGSRRSAKGEESSYHHGDLHEALLKAAEAVLERDGLAGLTLRAVAREAGVSHAAPTHHFGDLTGLVSELAAIGFRQFNAAMMAAPKSAAWAEAAMARAKAYVAYARANPGMYLLMFRTERLDFSRPALREAGDAAFAGLAGAVGAGRHEHISDEALSLSQAADIARSWSLVHGFTMLMLDGRLDDILRRLGGGSDVETLLAAMLRSAIGLRPTTS